jgi:hypothetical protein
MDDYFNNIVKDKLKIVYLIILEKLKTCNFSTNGHILYNGNNIVKCLMIKLLNSQRF